MRRLVALLAPTLLVLAALEAGLRLAGVAPSGWFEFVVARGEHGLYPPNARFVNRWGPISYTVTTNALGLRSVPGAGVAQPGDVRIATLGDSATDGFFVDDADTFQAALQRELEGIEPRHVVLNAARGGGSIDMQLAVLREVVLPLEPRIVVLTFVTNDLWDLRGKTRRELLAHESRYRHDSTSPVYRALLRTAIGELLLRGWWSVRMRPGGAPPLEADARYRIEGGDRFAENAALFRERFAASDGLALQDPPSAATRRLLGDYLFVLRRFAALCERHGIARVFVYFPAYPQIYDPSTPTAVRDVLAVRTRELGFHWLDLTPVFRAEGGHVLHLAPLDFHPNPAGHRAFGRALFRFLVDEGLVPAASGEAAAPRYSQLRLAAPSS